ncbi:hypothetical protein ACLOJK_008895 [Asimina triloba]
MGAWENTGGGANFPGIVRIFRVISYAGMMSYTFVLGVEMDLRSIFRRPDRPAIIAYAGIFSSLVFFLSMSWLLKGDSLRMLAKDPHLDVILLPSLILANTASPLLTRLITDLKIGKTEVGRFAVSVGVINDMVTTSVLALLTAFGLYLFPRPDDVVNPTGPVSTIIFVGIELLFVAKVIPVFCSCINKLNPEGKPMSPPHLWLATALAAFLSMLPFLVGFSGILSAFVVGLFYPREGRLSRQMVHKTNIMLNIFVFPILFGWVGYETAFRIVSTGRKVSARGAIARIFTFVAVGTLGKVAGTVIAAVCLQFQLLEAIALGLLLSSKGHFHIYYCLAAQLHPNLMPEAYPELLASFLVSIIFIPVAVKLIIKQSRQRANQRPMTIQWHEQMGELRIMACLHGTHNIPAFINIIEASRGDPAINKQLTVFAMDLVELTQRTAATLTQGVGLDAVAVTEESIMQMRDEITEAVEAYVAESGEGLVVRRLLAISAFENMHEDICNAAGDALAMLIILPFHKTQGIDGGMVESYMKFKQVNRRVIQRAPCSVGILVDRGLGGTNQLSAAYACHEVAVIFIGGRDDREALCYAARMAHHPGIKLTAIRFLVDPSVGDAASSVGTSARLLTDLDELEKETALDEQCFADFYQRNVATGRVRYVEKFAVNGPETVATLRTLEGLYSLFVAGRGTPSTSILTAGMSEWEENPELGPIGDNLASSDFSVTASVLIIKQHCCGKQDPDESDDEFSIM